MADKKPRDLLAKPHFVAQMNQLGMTIVNMPGIKCSECKTPLEENQDRGVFCPTCPTSLDKVH